MDSDQLQTLVTHDNITVASTTDSAADVTAAAQGDGRTPPQKAAEPKAAKADKQPSGAADSPPAAETAPVSETVDDLTQDTEDDDDDAATTDANADPGAPKKGRYGKRIKQLSGKLHAEQQRAERLERELAALKAAPPPAAKPAAAPLPASDTKPAAAATDAEANATADADPDAPTPADYPTYEEFLDARDEHRDQAKARIAAEAEQKRQKAATEQERQRNWRERVEAAQEEYEDFDEVAFSEKTPMSTTMQEAVLESEVGPEVLYYLGQHPEESLRIAQLAPTATLRAMGRLEAQFTKPGTTKSEAAEETRPKLSSAPDPIHPVGGARSTGSTKRPEEMSQPEYRAWREKNGRAA